MFEKKEYIVNSNLGICIVEKITKLVVGRESQMEYYVLRSATDKNKKAYIPLEHHETVLRHPMTETQAKEMIEKMPINTNDREGDRQITLGEAKEWLDCAEPEKWAKAAVLFLLHGEEYDAQLKETLCKIWENFQGELAYVLKKNKEEVRRMMENRIK